MKKKNIINLIKAYSEKNDFAFKTEAINIANSFMDAGDIELARYVMTLISDVDAFVPQNYVSNYNFLTKCEHSSKSLPLPQEISKDIIGLVNAVSKNMDVNKFLFYGYPGTGKTETAKHMARILDKDLFKVNFETLIDSKLGQTAKNISDMFDEINSLVVPSKSIILFDEIDALVLNRSDSNDIREMARATSTFLRKLDELNNNIIIIGTTNLFDQMDKALLRRFDALIDFSRYSREDLIDLSVVLLDEYIDKVPNLYKDTRLFKKIINCFNQIPYPAELKNIIKTSVAFSDPNDNVDYMKRILIKAIGEDITSDNIKDKGFTLREIEVLTGISKSQLSRLYSARR